MLTLKSSHRPDGKMPFVDMSISILIFDDGCCLDLSVSSTCHLRLKLPKFPIAPMGILLTCLPRLTLAQLRTLRSTTECTCCRDLANFPSPRWDFHMSRALCFQGGGVYVESGTVTFSSCTITGNTAYFVCARTQNFPSPRWENC